jgi:MoxR-like ATPase
MAQAIAYINRRDYVLPEDVRFVLPYVAGHRIMLNTKARVNDLTVDDVINQVIESVEAPDFNTDFMLNI